YCNQRDQRHERAAEILGEIRTGKYGVPFTSDYVFDEAVTLALARTGRREIVLKVGDVILPTSPEERFVELIHTSEEDFVEAWDAMRGHVEAGLSFTDWVTVQLVRRRGIDLVVSFDKRLDGWVQRIG
ncbi:MAG: PIN domain-containing protein, partial [Candidatus Thermoplasmatota archaeon]|nr:PIN domain-containing protein [Candidatus Thermoplasmatota archaeon]